MGGVTCSEGTRVNSRGQTLHTVEYIPEGQPPQALLFFQHGYGEHIGRYRSGVCSQSSKCLNQHLGQLPSAQNNMQYHV